MYIYREREATLAQEEKKETKQTLNLPLFALIFICALEIMLALEPRRNSGVIIYPVLDL